MSALQDLYAILGVPPAATQDDIRRAYRIAARRFHPDANKHPGAQLQFRDIAAAYEVLSDPGLRTQYDVRRREVDFSKAYFSLRLTPSRRVLTAIPEQQVLYMLAELACDRFLADQANMPTSTPLNLTLIIDRSLSMKGARLERTKAAAFQILEHLSDKDILSIIGFSDRAEVLVKAGPITDKNEIRAQITPLTTSGATEIYQGLMLGYQENLKHCNPKYVNHIVLITDGHTYGDEQQSLDLAEKAVAQGISISALGIGEEWNDHFLDQLAGRTGGSSQYIASPNQVITFLNEHIRVLTNALADRVTMSFAPDPDVKIETIFRLSPSAQPLPLDTDPIPIGQLQAQSFVSVILQLSLPPLDPTSMKSIIRVDVTGDIVREQRRGYKSVTDSVLEISSDAPPEDPPLVILDALSKLTLYKMQQKAEEALKRGNVTEATSRLQKLATRYLEAGQPELANIALAEAERVAAGGGSAALSEEGHKRMKYGTRQLMLAAPRAQK